MMLIIKRIGHTYGKIIAAFGQSRVMKPDYQGVLKQRFGSLIIFHDVRYREIDMDAYIKYVYFACVI